MLPPERLSLADVASTQTRFLPPEFFGGLQSQRTAGLSPCDTSWELFVDGQDRSQITCLPTVHLPGLQSRQTAGHSFLALNSKIQLLRCGCTVVCSPLPHGRSHFVVTPATVRVDCRGRGGGSVFREMPAKWAGLDVADRKTWV